MAAFVGVADLVKEVVQIECTNFAITTPLARSYALCSVVVSHCISSNAAEGATTLSSPAARVAKSLVRTYQLPHAALDACLGLMKDSSGLRLLAQFTRRMLLAGYCGYGGRLSNEFSATMGRFQKAIVRSKAY